MVTISELIEKLQQFKNKNMEVVICTPQARIDEFVPINRIRIKNIMDQNADGDPYYFEDRMVITIGE